MDKILVLGVGNMLLSDEGLGIRAVEYMQQLGLPDYFDLLDGGTGGFHLLSMFEDYKKVILIDAALDNNPVGSIKVVNPKFSNDFPKALSTHDIGLKDLIDATNILELIPEIVLIAVTISPQQELGLELSHEIKEKLPAIYKEVLKAGVLLNRDDFNFENPN